MEILAINLLQIPKLTELDLSTNTLNNLFLHLGLNDIHEIGCTLLANNLKFIPKLLKLDLGNILDIYIYILIVGKNKINISGCKALATNLRFIPNLENLNLSI